MCIRDRLSTLGLLNDHTPALDGDEGIGSLSPPDPLLLGVDQSPWCRTTAGLTTGLESTSGSGRRSWIEAVEWGAPVGGAVRLTDSSSDSPTNDCISVTPPRSPMACLFG